MQTMNYLHLSPEGSEVAVSRVIGSALPIPWGTGRGPSLAVVAPVPGAQIYASSRQLIAELRSLPVVNPQSEQR